ncbi:BglG family transcription antiterminator [Amphibacillus cookii]|uniref:BglG family transcription antiterminator n=1 Tax=Amphibacillus cookii TaxID=767787 RepID=UPI00195C231B|nr:BglG family transcription antiterminator [Amphibacillus cookii]MBM7539949.1 lichenan operon transcriptional antiterminator [Amphibacillus cookii]
MRTMTLLGILEKYDRPVTKVILSERMNLSESSIRNVVRDSNQIGEKNGFQIELIRGQGYVLHITSRERYDQFVVNETHRSEMYNPEQRVNFIISFLLQAENYVTIDQIATHMDVSRNTIVKDLKEVEKKVAASDLFLEKKVHYGLRVLGEESDYRRAFSKYVLTDYYLTPVKEFKTFRSLFNLDELRKVVNEALMANDLKMSDVAFENVVRHIRILIFRSLKSNFVSSYKHLKVEPEKGYYQVAEQIVTWINKKYDVVLPQSEMMFLAAHISGKVSIAKIDDQEKAEIDNQLGEILQTLDSAFSTYFTNDPVLRNDLLFHMLPLMKRLYYNMQLENPLVEEIYSKYANVFVIAFRFSELIEKKYGYQMSRDEVGYVAIHFAAHLERIKSVSLEKYKRIVVICTTGGGSAELLRLNLENIFSNAYISTASINNFKQYKDDPPDLFLSTVPMEASYAQVPIIQINEWIDEDEIRRIKDIISFQIHHKLDNQEITGLKDLFNEDIFYREKSDIDYLSLLKLRADDLVAKGYAVDYFPNSVLEREKKFTTIYRNGVAGPHAMKLDAMKDAVSVTILPEPIYYNDRTIQIIFLINLKAGHLFLHKELSRLLMRLMDHDYIRQRLIQTKNFRQFMAELELLI